MHRTIIKACRMYFSLPKIVECMVVCFPHSPADSLASLKRPGAHEKEAASDAALVVSKVCAFKMSHRHTSGVIDIFKAEMVLPSSDSDLPGYWLSNRAH